MISDYLTTGRANARTGKQLARLLHCNIRDITAGIERERRQGVPIIASYDKEQPGYYLAETAEELQRYCSILDHRAGEMRATSSILLLTAEGLPQEAAGKWET